MFAEVITIGDELLIGQVVDTNSAWMGQELNKIGIEVLRLSLIHICIVSLFIFIPVLAFSLAPT